jgi:hypothetical protein
MEIRPFAEVVGKERVSLELAEAGGSSGRPLSEYMDDVDADGNFEFPIPEQMKAELRRIYDSTGDPRCLEIANSEVVYIPMGHLAECDRSTKVRVGFLMSYTPEESRALGFRDPDFAARKDRGSSAGA